MNSEKQGTNKLVLVGATGGMLLMLFFAKMMFDMVNYVGSMSQNMQVMSKEIVNISQKIDIMTENISQLNNSVEDMDISMKKMHHDIHDIQEDISRDMNSMATDMRKGIKTFTTASGIAEIFLP